MNFEITGKEPHQPNETFTVIVNARNETEAKKYVRWNFALPKYSRRLQAFKTNNDAQYFVTDKDRKHFN